MRRELFTAVSVLSLLLCVATVVLWVRSWVHPPTPMPERFFLVASGAPVFEGWYFVSGTNIINVQLDRGWVGIAGYPSNPFQQRIGDWQPFSFRLHFAFLLVAFAVPPTMFLFRGCRSTGGQGHCHRCSYNLTGNTSGGCPECGSPVPGKAGT